MRPDLPPDLLEVWEERAAVMEFDAGMPRDQAEREALRCVERQAGIARQGELPLTGMAPTPQAMAVGRGRG